MLPGEVELDVRLSNAEITPAPCINALYPPPDTAMAIFGNAETFPLIYWMYALASKPLIFARIRKSRIAQMVFALLFSSHSVSLELRDVDFRTVGREFGHSIECGV